ATFAAGWLLGHVPFEVVFPVAAVIGILAAIVFSRINPREATNDERPAEVAGHATGTGRSAPESGASLGPAKKRALHRWTVVVRRRWRAGSFVLRLRETVAYLRSVFAILREDPAYRWFALSVFTYGFGNLLMMPIIPLIQVDQLGMTTTEM